MIDVVLRAGRERSVERRHPWVMSGSVDRAGDAKPGALVRVVSHQKRTLGYGHYSPASQIRVRMISFGDGPAPSDDLLAGRIRAAIARRADDPLCSGTDALRLVNSEGDDLPGLTVDRFAGVVVVKMTTAGMIVRRDAIAAALREHTGAASGLERADKSALEREGIEPREGVLWGDAPADLVWIDERGRRYAVDVTAGQKTGFYVDQRDARDVVESLSRGRSMLDLYAHTGGFAVAAARGGATRLTIVESSKDALDVARVNMNANAPELAADFVQADVHRFLREHDASYDVIVIDPPPLAKTKKDVDRAARAHKDSMLYGFRRASPGAFVLVFSCSHHIGPQLFRQIAFGASLDARRSFQVLRELSQPVDHPVSIDHPEGAYLTGLVLRASS